MYHELNSASSASVVGFSSLITGLKIIAKAIQFFMYVTSWPLINLLKNIMSVYFFRVPIAHYLKKGMSIANKMRINTTSIKVTIVIGTWYFLYVS
jgi:hypothetical protein